MTTLGTSSAAARGATGWSSVSGAADTRSRAGAWIRIRSQRTTIVLSAGTSPHTHSQSLQRREPVTGAPFQTTASGLTDAGSITVAPCNAVPVGLDNSSAHSARGVTARHCIPRNHLASSPTVGFHKRPEPTAAVRQSSATCHAGAARGSAWSGENIPATYGSVLRSEEHTSEL